MYGDAAYSQAPYSSLGDYSNLAGSSFLYLTAGGDTGGRKRVVATNSNGRRSGLAIKSGSIISITRIDDNTIEINIFQKGNSRTGSIYDPNGIVSYELT